MRLPPQVTHEVMVLYLHMVTMCEPCAVQLWFYGNGQYAVLLGFSCRKPPSTAVQALPSGFPKR